MLFRFTSTIIPRINQLLSAGVIIVNLEQVTMPLQPAKGKYPTVQEGKDDEIVVERSAIANKPPDKTMRLLMTIGHRNLNCYYY